MCHASVHLIFWLQGPCLHNEVEMMYRCRGRHSPQPEVGAHQVSLTGNIGCRVGGCGGEP
eukprot:13160761-Alexandrium_andersonii.AAC.1